MKRIILFLILYFIAYFYLHYHLVAQEKVYIITTQELERLEIISENWQIQKQRQLREVKALTGKLEEALKGCEDLKSLLKQEMEISKSLRQSFDAYENEVQNEINNLTFNIHKKELLIEKQKRRILLLVGFSIFIVLVSVSFFFLKAKLKIF